MMQTTRRNLIKFAAGAGVGALFTPAPWRLITDAALWSENWPGIPRPAEGEMRTRFNHCSLCPAGCAVRARCVGEQPVSLAGVKDHPLSRGALCPWGVAGHQAAYHPARLRSGPVEEAAAAVSERAARGARVAALDLRPGRTASWTYRRAMAALPNGVYITNPAPNYGFDLAEARTVLSLGAPLADGWGTPGNVFAARERFRLIQADAIETRTASVADLWLPVSPGSNTALAQAVAGEITAAEASRRTGVPEEKVRDVVAELRANGPSLVLGDGADVMEANRALGAFGKTVVARRETPVPDAWHGSAAVTALEDVADRSLDALIMDGEGMPWSWIASKLKADAIVVAFAWTADAHARFTLPAPVFGEALDDIPSAVDCPAAVFRLALPWMAGSLVHPAEFVAKIAGVNAESALRERANAICQAKRGTVFTPGDGKTTALKEMAAEDFWKALQAGACWIDERGPLPDGRAASSGSDVKVRGAGVSEGPLAIVVGESAPPGLVSPLSSKLYRESNLRQAMQVIALAPETARSCGVAAGGRAVLETGGERRNVTVAIDAGLPPDVVRIASRDCVTGTRGKVVAA